jgi:hypothetical protein
VLWKADAESSMDQEWAEISTATNCAIETFAGISDGRITRVTSPDSQGGYAYRVEVRDGDNCYGERAEVGQANPDRSDMTDRLFNDGQDRWISWRVDLASQALLDSTSWQAMTQFKHEGGGAGGPVTLELINGRWGLSLATSQDLNNGTADHYDLGPAVLNHWARFTFHIVFSHDPSVGSVEVFGDPDGAGMRPLFTNRTTPTLQYDSLNGNLWHPTHVRMGIYRNSATSGTAVAYYDGFTVGTTREAAEDG